MRNKAIIVAVAIAGANIACSQSLGIGSKAPEIKAHKIVQGTNSTFGDGKLHIIEMFATW